MTRAYVVISCVAVLLPPYSIGSGGGTAAEFLSSLVAGKAQIAAHDAGALVRQTEQMMAAMRTFKFHDRHTVATAADQLHDHLSKLYNATATSNGSETDQAIAFLAALKRLMTAIDTLATWITQGGPKAVTNPPWRVPMTTAIGEWNSATTALWRAAGAAGAPPTISTPA